MKKSVLTLYKSTKRLWHCIFKNNHSRKIYTRIAMSDNSKRITICDCFYIDRPWESSAKAVPLKNVTTCCNLEDLPKVFEAELDKKIYGIEFVDDGRFLSTEEYIQNFLDAKKKHKFLILVESGNVLKTRLKNRTHRVIYLELKKDDKRALICSCYYCDRTYTRDKSLITPAGLTSVYFEYSLDAVLNVANDELNCDFTDVIVTPDTFGFDKTDLPICGSI